MIATCRTTAVLAVAVVALLLSGTQAIAQQLQAQVGYPCGRVTAFAAPSSTSEGSITIGTRTFVARAGSLPNPPPPIAVGATLCLTGQLDASGAFTSLTASTFGDSLCGAVVAYTPPSATASGTITIRTNVEWTLPVRASTSLSSAQTTGNQCFKYELNAQGNAEIVSSAGAPQTVTGTPQPPSAAASQLPSTSTGTTPAPADELGVIRLTLLSAILIAVVVAALALRRRLSF